MSLNQPFQVLGRLLQFQYEATGNIQPADQSIFNKLVATIRRLTCLPTSDVAEILSNLSDQKVEEGLAENLLQKAGMNDNSRNEVLAACGFTNKTQELGNIYVSGLTFFKNNREHHLAVGVDLASYFIYWNLYDRKKRNLPYLFLEQLMEKFPIGVRSISFDRGFLLNNEKNVLNEAKGFQLQDRCDKKKIRLNICDLPFAWKPTSLKFVNEGATDNKSDESVRQMKKLMEHLMLDFNFNRPLGANGGMSPFSKVIEFIHKNSKTKLKA